MNIEEIKEKYLSEDHAREQSGVIFREDVKGLRYYIRVNEENRISIAPSVTSIISCTRPLARHLIDWMIRNGAEKIEWFKEQSANYGTFIHVVFSEILCGKTYELNKDSLLEKMKVWFLSYQYDFDECMKWYKMEKRDIQKDVYSFMCWVRDFEIEPVAIEYILMSPVRKTFFCRDENTEEKNRLKSADSMGCMNEKEKRNCSECEQAVAINDMAGAIDLVCLARLKKDQEKQRIIVDWKTGLKGFYDEHAIQLRMYREMWNMENPDYPIEKIYNFAPKGYRLPLGKTVIPYSFKNQTSNKDKNLWNLYIEIFHRQEKYFDFSAKTTFADIEISCGMDLNDDVFVANDIFQEVIEYMSQRGEF